MRSLLTAVILVTSLTPASARASGWNTGPFVIGGRAEYVASVDREAGPFPWNDATKSAYGRTRVMVDVTADTTRWGSLYIKGAALWDDTRPEDFQKKLRFEQGDYLWTNTLGQSGYAARAFANERRFFVEDGVAPLIHNDDVDRADGNWGARMDGHWRQRLRLTGLHSVLGENINDERAMSYAAARYDFGPVDLGASYLFDDFGRLAPRNQATLKLDIAAGWRWTYFLFAYQQSKLDDASFFLPGGRFAWDGFGSLQSSLPAGGALIAEARANEVPVGEGARMRLTYRYEAAGNDFVNDLGWNRGARSAHTGQAFIQATTVDLNGRLRYQHARRYELSREESDAVEATFWGALRAGVWVIARGIVAQVEDGTPRDDIDRNLIHLGAERRIREIRSGAHLMWQDLGTDFSDQRFAIDGKFPISSSWGMYSRVIASRDFDVAHAVYIRIEYRPNNRIFATLSYGREDIGDGPYMIEDFDVDLARVGTPVFGFSIRGDF